MRSYNSYPCVKMERFTGLLILGLFLVGNNCSDISKPRIAIVGAGIGGASTSHFLTKLLEGNLEIDIFESDKIGGRLATIEIGGNDYEAGGSLINSGHKYMKNFVKILGMKEIRSPNSTRVGVWNGNEFIIKESGWKIVTLMKLLFRYGIQPIKLYRHVKSILDSFRTIYQHQENGMAYNNVIELLSAINPEIPKLLEKSTLEYLHSQGFSKDIINELVEAILVVYYGQNTDVHSFLGCLSVADAVGDLWSVKGGNKEVPTQLIRRNDKVRLMVSQVKTIRYFLNEDSLSQYEITHSNAGSNNVAKNIYDIVVLATPLTGDQKHPINYLGFSKNDSPHIPGNYQKTVATFVKGDLNLSRFGLEESLNAILSCDPNRTEVNFINAVFPVNGTSESNSKVWRVFSKKPLTSHQITSMFSQVELVKDITWKAYPIYETSPRLDKFQLYDSLYHVNAIEWAASAMEMSAIAGRNVAILIHGKLTSCCRDSSLKRRKSCKYYCKGKKDSKEPRNVEL